ncbi:hypothetical protein EXIGLDRAFT_579149, partial [Exidia glandulosa HHB12029]
IPETLDDVLLNGLRVSHLEQADDIIIFAKSPEALQLKLDAFFAWCCRNLLVINGRKSWWMPLGCRPVAIPSFNINGADVPLEHEKSYVGMILNSSLSLEQRAHTADKAARAHRISCLVFGRHNQRNKFPPRPARKLYMGLVDPHLTHGADVLPDSTKIATKKLETVQKTYLRKLLRVGPRSKVAPLFTETGVSPIRYRRADLAVRYLGYALQRPAEDLVRCAVLDSASLLAARAKSWVGDLAKALSLLPVPVGFEMPADDEIECSAKLPLLRGRLHENCFLQARPRPAPVSTFRGYLKLYAREHRTALTRLLLSDHGLAVERLRYEGVAHEDRMCRFCLVEVEDEMHALFACDGNEELARLR